MSTSNRLRKLEEQLLQEKNPSERQEILACVLTQIQIGWNELFESIASEQSSDRMLLLLAELDEMLEKRKAQVPTKGGVPGSASDSGSSREASADAGGKYVEAHAGAGEKSRVSQTWLKSA